MKKMTLEDFKRLHDKMDIMGYAYDSENQKWHDLIGVSFRADELLVSPMNRQVCLKHGRDYMRFNNVKYVIQERGFEWVRIFTFMCGKQSGTENDIPYTVLVITR